jgi:hypothetical protein
VGKKLFKKKYESITLGTYGRKVWQRIFQVGDLVYFKLQPYKQKSLALRKNMKLDPRFYEPYKIV